MIACTDSLADIAADLPQAAGAGYELRLRQVVDAQRPSFDFILLDTPPGLGSLSGMALLAADWLVIPALAADLDVRGAGKLYDLVESELPGLRILGVLIAASERRWRVTRDAAARMQEDRMKVLPFAVPRAVRVASAPRHWAPIAVLEPDSIITGTPTGCSRSTSSRSAGDEQPPTDATSPPTTNRRHAGSHARTDRRRAGPHRDRGPDLLGGSRACGRLDCGPARRRGRRGGGGPAF